MGLSGCAPAEALVTTSIVHRGMTWLGGFLANPMALVALALFTLAWSMFEPESLDWHGAATLITLAIAVIIERNQKRDTAALQLKLDELILATGGARDEVAELERREPNEMERLRDARDAGDQ
jgi:low affinity Fe/Cu permease